MASNVPPKRQYPPGYHPADEEPASQSPDTSEPSPTGDSPTTADGPPQEPPENAGFWLRFFAYLFDTSILSVLYYLVSQFAKSYIDASIGTLIESFGTGPGAFVAILIPLLLLLVFSLCIGLLYHALFEASSLMGSPGKLLTGLCVTDLDFNRISGARALGRNLSKFFSSLTLGVGYLMAGLTAQKQGLHDMIASTLVVRHPDVDTGRRMAGVLISIGAFVLCKFVLPSYEPSSIKSHRYSGNYSYSTPLPKPGGRAIYTTPDGHTVTFPQTGIGSIEAGPKKVTLAAAYARLRTLKEVPNEISRYVMERSARKLEIAFFDTELTDVEQDQLATARSLLNDSEKMIAKAAVAELSLYLPEFIQICTTDQIRYATLEVQGSLAPQEALSDSKTLLFQIDPAALASQGLFDWGCPTLDVGKDLSLSIQGTKTFTGISHEQIFWNIRLSSAIHAPAIPPRKGFHFDTFQDSIAVWDPSKNLLTVGVFPTLIPEPEIRAVQNRLSLTAITSTKPDMIIRIPIAPRVSTISVDSVRQGYMIELYRNTSGNIKFPGTESKVTVELPPGEFPATLSARLNPIAKRLIIRVEGSVTTDKENNPFDLSWSIAANTLLVTAKKESFESDKFQIVGH